MDELRIERLAEHVDAFGKDDAVQAVLQAVVLAADVELAERVLRDVGCLQDDLIEQCVVAAGRGGNGSFVDGIGRSSRLGLDGGTGFIQPGCRNDDTRHFARRAFARTGRSSGAISGGGRRVRGVSDGSVSRRVCSRGACCGLDEGGIGGRESQGRCDDAANVVLGTKHEITPQSANAGRGQCVAMTTFTANSRNSRRSRQRLVPFKGTGQPRRWRKALDQFGGVGRAARQVTANTTALGADDLGASDRSAHHQDGLAYNSDLRR